MPVTIKIEDLYPFECGYVISFVDKYIRQYEKNEKVEMPKALQLSDGSWMIVDGTHRVVAAQKRGLKEIECIQISRREMKPFEETKAQRDQKNQKGFVNFPSFNSLTDRRNANKKELNELPKIRTDPSR